MKCETLLTPPSMVKQVDDNNSPSKKQTTTQKTMAVTKFQVMLNDLVLKHKASLLLYDEIIELINSCISSPSFNILKSNSRLLELN